MNRLRPLGLLLRQLTAHDAYVLRRALAETTAAALVRLAPALPGAARAADRLHPASPEVKQALAARAARRGDDEAAARHRAAADRLSHNTLETHVLTALRNTLAWRRARRRRGGTGGATGATGDVERLLAAGDFDAAAAGARAAAACSTGSRVDALVRVAAAARAAGRAALAASLLYEARDLDRGRADVFRLLGGLALDAGDAAEARGHLEVAVALDPADPSALRELAAAVRHEDPERALELLWDALERAPDDDAVLHDLESSAASQGGGAAQLDLRVDVPPPGRLAVGERAPLRLSVAGGPAALYVIEPFAAGVACAPHGRVAVGPGEQRVEIALGARRPDAANGGRPWRIHAALVAGAQVARVAVDVAVPDERPASVYYLVTEDHELYDEREATEPQLARTTLVDKSRLAERIANARGARWTHMVDVASLALVDWASAQSAAGVWAEVRRACGEHLCEAVAGGNDLGLHIHAFHDPASPGFCHGFETGADRVTTQRAFLETPLPERGFWSRAFPALGSVDEPGTRAWATWRGIGALEALGRLGDPGFGLTLFRAGSFDFGDDASERARSLALLAHLGVLADSDVPKPRLYHRAMGRSVYPAGDDLHRPEPDPARQRVLEIRPEFNVEADFLSDVGVLNAYVDARLDALRRPGGGLAPGVHVVCAMTHDKFINWRMGRCWDSLEPGYGDWATIDAHLRHVAERHPEVRFARVRDAVLAWYDRYAPRLLAWRDEEIVELAPPERDAERYRYPLRLLGAGIEVSAERPRRVRVLPPAWLHGSIRDAWIERDGQRVAARREPVAPGALWLQVDTHDAAFELVVEAAPGAGITAQPQGDGRRLRLRSALAYRRAHVELPAALSPDGRRRRLRDVRLEASRDAYEATVDLDAAPLS